ncbi:uncharacterized protein LOC131950096 [Physella acuta]|uniref:uncharacterized protein LOC131950096 n=1 Tax=Physella acuta TaxID=109671 RepID=UPI0027DD1D4D|nr:uncharacterized protein LOC131950096 [Physella acuta]
MYYILLVKRQACLHSMLDQAQKILRTLKMKVQITLMICAAFLQLHQTDSESAKPCSEENWVKFKDNCYFLTSGLDFRDTEQRCMECDGDLASVHSADENTFLFNQISGLTFKTVICKYVNTCPLYSYDHFALSPPPTVNARCKLIVSENIKI